MYIKLTDYEKRIVAYVLKYFIHQACAYYYPEEDSYCNDLNHEFDGWYIRDLLEISERFIDPEDYERLKKEIEKFK